MKTGPVWRTDCVGQFSRQWGQFRHPDDAGQNFHLRGEQAGQRDQPDNDDDDDNEDDDGDSDGDYVDDDDDDDYDDDDDNDDDEDKQPADCDVKHVQPGAGQVGDEHLVREDVFLHPPRLAVHHTLPDCCRIPPEVRLHPDLVELNYLTVSGDVTFGHLWSPAEWVDFAYWWNFSGGGSTCLFTRLDSLAWSQ